MYLKLIIILNYIFLFYCYAKSYKNNFINELNNLQKCEYVPFLLCENGTEIINSVGLLDIRSNLQQKLKRKYQMSNACKNFLEVCCKPPNVKSSDKEMSLIILQVGKNGCGIRNFKGVDLKIMNINKNEAKFGEFPWMVAILHSVLNELDVYQCGGILIHRKVVLTAAHCVNGKNESTLKIRAGEWNTQTTDESLPHQDRAIEAIVSHRNYHPRALYNDIALLFLNQPVEITKNVDIICLPESKHDFDDSKCIASGWGKNKFDKDGQHQKILKSIKLSIISQSLYQNVLRHTILSSKFELHESFICAGGMQGEDTCKGDGDGPLICPLEVDPQRFVQVGITSWGIACGSNLPGIYANIINTRSWIDEQLMFHNYDKTIYQHKQYIHKNSV